MQDGDFHTRSHAGVDKSMRKEQLKIKEIKIDVRRFGKYIEMLERKGKMILSSPAKTMEARRKFTIKYRTMNLKTKKIGMAPEEEMDTCLQDICNSLVFSTSGRRLGAVDVRSAEIVLADVFATTKPNNERTSALFD